MAETNHLRKAGRRLARDLRELREKLEIPLEDLLDATRLPRDIIAQFDETALVDHPAYNRVYLGYILRTCADVLGIDRQDALSALDQALEGTYDGELARKYLDADDESVSDGLTSDVNEGEEPEETSKEELDSIPGPGRKIVSDTGVLHRLLDSTSEFFSGWLLSLRQRLPSGKRALLPRQYRRTIFGSVASLVLFILWLLWLFQGPESSDYEQGDQALADTVVVSAEPDWIVLPDSMHFSVIARDDVLAPIRVRVDQDRQREYWVEHSDTAHFLVADSIEFSRWIYLARFQLEGIEIPDSFRENRNRIFMTRPRAQSWLDSLVVRAERR